MSEDTITTLDQDSTPSTSRRAMLGKIGAAGTIAWATPVILASPAAAAHESGHVDPPTPVCPTATAGAPVVLVSPPANARLNQYQHNTDIRVWQEQADFSIPAGGQSVDTTPGGGGAATIPAGTKVSVFFIHYDRVTGNGSATGTLTFDKTVLGLITTSSGLNGSDSTYTPGTLYPTTAAQGSATRGIESDDSAAATTTTTTVTMKGGDFDQVRVFVACE